jgi:DNA repair exonuclease SbcCD ATPase subunit
MNDQHMHNGTFADPVALLERDNDLHSPELEALRDARKRAADARIAAENALMQAHAAEAKLIAEEERATAAALAARHGQLVDAIDVAAERERLALEDLSKIEAQLHESHRARDEIQAESNRVAQSLDEAKRTLENLVAAAAEQAQRSESAAATERQLETERLAVLQCAQGSTQLRKQAEAALALLQTPLPQQIAAPTDPPADAFDLAAARAQRVAERRAADAARAASAASA